VSYIKFAQLMQSVGHEKGVFGWVKNWKKKLDVYIIINYEATTKTEFDVSAALRILYIFWTWCAIGLPFRGNTFTRKWGRPQMPLPFVMCLRLLVLQFYNP